MANFASITSEFSDASVLGSTFSITFVNITRGINKTVIWNCVTTRFSALQYAQGSDGGDQGSKALAAVNADIGNDVTLNPYMTVSLDIDSFAIEANEYGWTITAGATSGTPNITLTPTAEVLPAKDFQIISSSLAAAGTNPPCSHIEVTLTSNADGVGPFVWVTPAVTSLTVGQTTYAEIARQVAQQDLAITIDDDEGSTADPFNVLIPQLFTSALINSISQVTNPGGLDVAVTVFMDNPSSQFTYTYSVNGVDYQSSSVFPNMTDGSYTLYVNDGYGCIVTQGFTVLASSTIARPAAYAHIPLANPIRFILDSLSQYQNLHNTLYANEYYLGEYKPFYAQPYQNNDGVLLTQFRSNYDGLSAKLLDCDGETVDTFTIEQKSDNTGVTDFRDAVAYNKGNNQTGIYYTSGNIYDNLGDIIDTYTLDGQLPEYGIAGNTIVISSGPLIGSYIIKQVVFDSSVQANVLVLDNAWSEVSQTLSVVVECEYNKLPYEVWEFEWDLSTALAGTYTMQIAMTDSLMEYPDLVWNSDYICVNDLFHHTNLIKYSEDPYSTIDYSTGFIGRVRVKSLDAYASMEPAGTSVQYDDSVSNTKKLKDVSTMEGTMLIQELPRYMVEKMRLIFQHKTLEINDETWVTIDAMETTNFPKSALRNVSQKLKLVDYLPFANNNISIDGQLGRIVTSEGAILQ